MTLEGALNQHWHFQVELGPSVVTPGDARPALAIQRELLAGAEVRGARCIEFGTMEGVLPVLMHRRGAAEVIGYDRIDFGVKVRAVQDAYGTPYPFLTNITYNQAVDRFRAEGKRFDLICFCGILYHFIDPLGSFARARTLLRDGGLMLVETSAVLDDEFSLHMGAHGRFYDSTDWFHPTTAALQYMLKILRLRPVDIRFYRQQKDKLTDKVLYRVAVMCRALSHSAADPQDGWIDQPRKKWDYEEVLDWSYTAGDAPDLPYAAPANSRFVTEADGITVDIGRTLREMPQSDIDAARTVLRLDHHV